MQIDRKDFALMLFLMATPLARNMPNAVTFNALLQLASRNGLEFVVAVLALWHLHTYIKELEEELARRNEIIRRLLTRRLHSRNGP